MKDSTELTIQLQLLGAVMNENHGVRFLKGEETSLDRDEIACLKADKIVAHGDT